MAIPTVTVGNATKKTDYDNIAGKVACSADDATVDELDAKLASTGNVTFTVNNGGATENISAAAKVLVYITPVDISAALTADGTWRDYDATGDTAAKAVGVRLAVRIKRTLAEGGTVSIAYFYARTKGSAADFEGILEQSFTSQAVGQGNGNYYAGGNVDVFVDGDNIFQYKIGTVTTKEIFIVGYWVET
jgi:hypothetical protein